VQKGVGVPADGKIGPKTIAAARKAGARGIQRACAARMAFLQGLRTWRSFGRGWSRRVASTEAVAVGMLGIPANQIAAYGNEASAASKRNTTGAAVSAGGSAATGGATDSSAITGLPDSALYIVAAICAVAVVVLIVRALHHNRRAKAYAEVASEVASHE
jgi:lysozyme family protein